MDIEKARRAELRAALEDRFICFNEVPLRHALFTKHCIRADMVAIPLDQRFLAYALAFEVKEPEASDRNFAAWGHALKQASDYVYAKIEPSAAQPGLQQFVGRRVSGAFIFPSPIYNPNGRELTAKELLVPQGEQMLVAGAMHLALHFRVGSAAWQQTGKRRRFCLSFGSERSLAN